MDDVRLIDANALDRNFFDSCTGECGNCSCYNYFDHGASGCGLIYLAPTIAAVPFETLSGVCKHGHIACVDSDNRVYGRVCRKNNPYSFETCSPETCPIIDGKEDAPCE